MELFAMFHKFKDSETHHIFPLPIFFDPISFIRLLLLNANLWQDLVTYYYRYRVVNRRKVKGEIRIKGEFNTKIKNFNDNHLIWQKSKYSKRIDVSIYACKYHSPAVVRSQIKSV